MKVALGIMLVLLLGASAALYALAADPGSRDDPLATVSYVQRHAGFKHVELSAGQRFRLGIGSEMVVIEPAADIIDLKGFDPLRDTLINLSEGQAVGGPGIGAHQLYLNASTHDITIVPDKPVHLMARGEWQ
jgi:hypothetical protein